MARSPSLTRRAHLSVTQLEDRLVPAGLIDVISGPGYLLIQGDASDNHVRVKIESWSGPTRQVNIISNSGPIRVTDYLTNEASVTDQVVIEYSYGLDTLNINTGNGNDGIEVNGPEGSKYYLDFNSLLVESGNGDDHVLIDDIRAALYVNTGRGADQVILRECYGYNVPQNPLYSYAVMNTGYGDDHVLLQGINDYLSLEFFLGEGDDVLEGDPQYSLPRDDYHWFVATGEGGDDFLLNADYFPHRELPYVFGFEEIT